MFNVRTDLAIEAREIYAKEHKNKSEIDGVIVKEENKSRVKVTKVEVTSESGAQKIGKPVGNYITIDMPELTSYDGEVIDDISEVLADNISELVDTSKTSSTLVVGLGNWNVTPDSLGPKVAEKIMITRHLKTMMPDSIDDAVRSVCAIAPGVLGTTGIETGEIIKSLVDKIKPSLVICIDALASRRLERVNRTIQLGDTGIAPGAGVGNHRMQINKENLGVPVLAIGVPTVVDAATIANDTIDLLLDEMIENSDKGGEFYSMLKTIDKKEKSKLIKEVLNPYVGSLMVTPKDVDTIIEAVSRIISNGINLALQPDLEIEDINKFMN